MRPRLKLWRGSPDLPARPRFVPLAALAFASPTQFLSRRNAHFAGPHTPPARAERVGGVLFGKPLLALGCGGEAFQKVRLPAAELDSRGGRGRETPEKESIEPDDLA